MQTFSCNFFLFQSEWYKSYIHLKMGRILAIRRHRENLQELYLICNLKKNLRFTWSTILPPNLGQQLAILSWIRNLFLYKIQIKAGPICWKSLILVCFNTVHCTGMYEIYITTYRGIGGKKRYLEKKLRLSYFSRNFIWHILSKQKLFYQNLCQFDRKHHVTNVKLDKHRISPILDEIFLTFFGHIPGMLVH